MRKRLQERDGYPAIVEAELALLDELALEGGWIASELSIEELRKFHHVNQYVSGVDDPSDFSFRIRPHLRAGPDAFRLDSRE